MKSGAQQKFPTLVASNEDGEKGEEPGKMRIGDLLRSRRLSRDVELQDVAAALRIRRPYLQAIEDGDLSQLPGATYAIGFVRAYSDYLGLDASETVDRFKAESAALEERTELVFPEPLPGSRVPGGALIFLALLLAGMSYGGWLYVSSQDRPIAELVPALPAGLAALLDGDSATSETAAAPAEALPEEGIQPSPPVTATTSSDDTVTATDAQAQTPAIAETPASDINAAPGATEPTAAPTDVVSNESTSQDSAAQAEAPVADPAEPPLAASAPDGVEADGAPLPGGAATGTETAAPDTSEPPATATATVAQPVSAPTPDASGSGGAGAPAPVSSHGDAAASASLDQTGREPANAAVESAAAPPVTAAQTDVANEQPNPLPTEVPDPVGTELENQTASAVPEVAAIEATVDALATSQPENASENSATEIAATAANEVGSATSNVETGSTALAAAPAIALPEGDGVLYGQENADARVVFRAKVATWVEIRDADRQIVFTRLMRPGDVYRVPNRLGLTMVTGNAGGLAVNVDGSAAPALGDLGDVRRDISLDPGTLVSR